MAKEDFRKVDDAPGSNCRKRAITLIKQGRKKGDIALLFGANKNTVGKVIKNGAQKVLLVKRKV